MSPSFERRETKELRTRERATLVEEARTLISDRLSHCEGDRDAEIRTLCGLKAEYDVAENDSRVPINNGNRYVVKEVVEMLLNYDYPFEAGKSTYLSVTTPMNPNEANLVRGAFKAGADNDNRAPVAAVA
jgi:hypothetical protein